jgi:hypothetical protein
MVTRMSRPARPRRVAVFENAAITSLEMAAVLLCERSMRTSGLLRGSSLATGLLVTATLVVGWDVRPARACGGFFCDRPQSSSLPPIAQAGENVLFVLDQDPATGQRRVEAHIQIVYQGAADQFSWVVPVTAAPTLDVGTDALFDRIEPATRPSFQVRYQMDGTCKGFGGGDSGGCGSSSAGLAAGGPVPESGAGVNGPAVEVVFHGNVGPYDSAVIRSDDPTALKTWLGDNGYYVSADASRIIDDYVAAHDFFVALRLQQGQEATAIRPIVLRMAAEEGCLPLKLTAIAATPDVRINVWVLGDARAVPLNYVEIEINSAKLDWFNFGANYDQVLGQAADEAGGNAFAVEYAQPAAAVGTQLMVAPAQKAALAEAPSPSAFFSDLRSMGFLPPQGEVLAVLRSDFPLPPALAATGVTEATFYTTLATNGFPLTTALPPFDAAKMSADLDAAVFTPLAGVAPLFSGHAYLTRLATFISPEEMTSDPLFVTNPSLPNVSNQHSAEAILLCGNEDFSAFDAPVRLRLEDGRDVVYAAGGMPYDRRDIDALPSAEVGYVRDPETAGRTVVDNRAAIATALATHNADALPRRDGCGCAVRGRARPASLALILVALALLRARRPRRPQA